MSQYRDAGRVPGNSTSQVFRPVDATGFSYAAGSGSDLFLTQRRGHFSRSRRPESRLSIAQRWMQRYHAAGMAGQAVR